MKTMTRTEKGGSAERRKKIFLLAHDKLLTIFVLYYYQQNPLLASSLTKILFIVFSHFSDVKGRPRDWNGFIIGLSWTVYIGDCPSTALSWAGLHYQLFTTLTTLSGFKMIYSERHFKAHTHLNLEYVSLSYLLQPLPAMNPITEMLQADVTWLHRIYHNFTAVRPSMFISVLCFMFCFISPTIAASVPCDGSSSQSKI